jgi:hypothetical protein
MLDNYADVDILVNGKPIKKFAHRNKLFIQSNHQTEYSIKIRNKGWSRRLFIVTVDGINVIDGQAGGKSKMGYIISGYSSYEVKGFRTSNSEVHPFKFSSKKKSYAAKSEETGGDTSNCGVIGIEVYEEKEKPKPQVIYRDRIIERREPQPIFPSTPWNTPHTPWPTITWTSSTTSQVRDGDALGSNTLNSAGNNLEWTSLTYSCNSSLDNVGRGMSCGNLRSANQVREIEPNFDMGTEFAKHAVSDSVTEVEFEIGNFLAGASIYYASREALQTMGIQLVKESQIPAFPQAFPSKFCKPPK